jgi:AraC family transcriptional regulator
MKKIENRIGTNLYSLQIYNEDYFEKFNPSAIFEKWALAEVSDFEYLPEGLKSFELHGGEYAVFNYTGSAENAPQIFGYIFGTWLPSSGYMLGNRPHFEVLGPKYKQNSSDSEEEIWIPVKTE